MLAKVIAVIFLSVFVLTEAVPTIKPKICAPEQWSAAVLGKTAQIVEGKAQVITTSGAQYVDYNKKREAFVQTITVGNEDTVNINVISDYNLQKMYEIYPDQEKCTTIDIKVSTFKRPCAGDVDLKNVGSLSLGGEDKMADMYEVAFHNSTMVMTVMRDSFSPVSAVIEQTYRGIPQMVAFQYGNVSDKIADASVLEIPTYCNQPERITPTRICAPEQWEAVSVGKIAQVVKQVPLTLSARIMTTWDYKNKLQATNSTIFYGGKMYHSRTVMDWKQGKLYQINLDQKICALLPPITSEMIELCSDSKMLKHVAALTVGGRDADVYRYAPSNYNYRVDMTMFRDSFEPISTLAEQVYMKIPQMLAMQFGNFTLGIKDRSVFDIPSYCPTEI